MAYEIVSLRERNHFTQHKKTVSLKEEKLISRREMYISAAGIYISRAEICISRREMNFSS